MPQTNIENTQYAESTRPEYVSGVTMDIELGKRLQPGESIDFDYDAFYDMAKAMGATDEEIAAIHVDIIDPIYADDKRHTGTYRRPDNGSPITEIVYKGSGEADQAVMNKALTHEFQHHIDARRGALEEVMPLSYVKGLESLRDRKYLVSFAVGMVGVAGAFLGPDGTELVAAPSAGLLAYSQVKMSQIWGYLNHPSEKRAIAAEKTHGAHQSISVG